MGVAHLHGDEKRSRTLHIRLSPAEDDRLRELAAQRQVGCAELIREALGLVGANPSPAVVPADRPDPKTEPGAAAMLEVAERIQRKKKGKT